MNDRSLIGLRLLNDYQRDFPLVAQPFTRIGESLGLDEATVMAAYGEGLASGEISRIGGVVAPRRLGASTLAALAVPPARLDEVASRVGAYAGINHNYEREDALNLWFVANAADPAGLTRLLTAIEADCQLPVHIMPLHTEYHIDLGFDLKDPAPRRPRPAPVGPETPVTGKAPLAEAHRALLAAIAKGLPLCSRPYQALGAPLGLAEATVLSQVQDFLTTGLLKRFGVVVRHRHLGYTANAMCVWDVPDEQVDRLGSALAATPGVTLCYRRQRNPAWPYNLYCMIHGKVRSAVLALRAARAEALGLDDYPHRILFSRRCFKQCGAHHPAEPTHE